MAEKGGIIAGGGLSWRRDAMLGRRREGGECKKIKEEYDTWGSHSSVFFFFGLDQGMDGKTVGSLALWLAIYFFI